MTQEEKELLKKDLSARIPYKVMGHVHTEDRADIIAPIVSISPSGESVFVQDNVFAWFATLEQTKPYLRPLSDMTEAEEMDFIKFKLKEITYGKNGYNALLSLDEIDYLNAHHFDYRGLIPMGIAEEAPKDMYKFDDAIKFE